VVDGSRCISYLTIELKNEIPQEFKGKMDNWMFGCDICQDVCPWNRFSVLNTEPAFTPHPDLHGIKNRTGRILHRMYSKRYLKTPL
jgi:epoxyqueuosine reductase